MFFFPLLVYAAQPESSTIFATVLQVLKFKIQIALKTLVEQPSMISGGGGKSLAFISGYQANTLLEERLPPPLIYLIYLLLCAFKYWMDVDTTPR